MLRRVNLSGMNGLPVEAVVDCDPTALEKRCIPITQTTAKLRQDVEKLFLVSQIIRTNLTSFTSEVSFGSCKLQQLRT